MSRTDTVLAYFNEQKKKIGRATGDRRETQPKKHGLKSRRSAVAFETPTSVCT